MILLKYKFIIIENASLIRYVQQSGGYYNSKFYSRRRSVWNGTFNDTIKGEEEELEKTLWPYTPK